MKQIEHNIVASFNLAKEDIGKLHDLIQELASKQKKLDDKIRALGDRQSKDHALVVAKPKTKVVTRTVTKTVTKRPKKVFVASKEADKFHIKSCPFAQNIKPKQKLTFKSKTTALNKGYKACRCVK